MSPHVTTYYWWWHVGNSWWDFSCASQLVKVLRGNDFEGEWSVGFLFAESYSCVFIAAQSKHRLFGDAVISSMRFLSKRVLDGKVQLRTYPRFFPAPHCAAMTVFPTFIHSQALPCGHTCSYTYTSGYCNISRGEVQRVKWAWVQLLSYFLPTLFVEEWRRCSQGFVSIHHSLVRLTVLILYQQKHRYVSHSKEATSFFWAYSR